MRGSVWALPGAALVIWVASVGYPAVAAVVAMGRMPRSDVDVRGAGTLLATSLGWALAVAVGAVVVGWAPGRLLGRALQGRGYLPIATAMLVPICVPAYVVFWCWWQAWPADSALGRFVIETGRVGLMRHATLFLALVLWSWPLVAWCVAGCVAAVPAEREELLRLDGAGAVTRLVDRARNDGRGLAIGGLIAFVAAFNNTTCFDLAEVFTFANELRAVAALGANARDVLAAAAPAVLIGGLGAAAVWFLIAGRPERAPTRAGRASRVTIGATALIWVLSVVIPLVLLLVGLAGVRKSGTFWAFYGGALLNTVALALLCGGVGAVVAIGLAGLWQDPRRWVRAVGHAQALGWLLAAAVPGTIVGVAVEAAYNTGVTAEVIYSSQAVLVIGYLARFGFVAALFGRWLIAQEPRTQGDLRRLDGAETWLGLMICAWPRMLAAGLGSGAVIAVLALGEIPVTARLHPPGSDPLALAVLNAMHYQRPYTVMLSVLVLVAAAAGAALVVTGGWWWLRRVSRSGAVTAGALALGVVVLLGTAGCVPDDPNQAEPLRPLLVFGSPGQALGQFNYPRGIAVDRQREFVYIVDKSARVQRFSFEGEPQVQWRTPRKENGKPTGLNVAPDGRVFVADTHYFRVIAYDRDGTELMRFGEYGEGPGQFIFPTDVEFGPGGRLYVSEYGGNDRIQVFTAEGEHLFGFGSPGLEVGQFDRPQSLVFNPSKTELYVADACNHRIVVVDPEGTTLRVLGGPGRGRGELSYPYDLMLLGDGSLLVCEFGNNRIQRLSPEGECLGLFGRVGPREGQLQYPWGIDGTGELIFVLDSGNNRVQVIRRPR